MQRAVYIHLLVGNAHQFCLLLNFDFGLATTTTTSKTPATKNWRTNGASNNSPPHKQRPPLVLGFPPQRGTQIDDSKEVQVKNAFR